eukprot:TRINITY_DN16594_c0_g1_i1.p1 TRINITY_DN16594_c0_g1~~TRINITY_DN16594_c0_g1_i1.p1  ORF type:complete len:103 (+),score=19.37 TRINITY_DN16594_c0_g1_i1:34-309(+)
MAEFGAPSGGSKPPQWLVSYMDKCTAAVPEPLHGFCVLTVPAVVLACLFLALFIFMRSQGLNMAGQPLQPDARLEDEKEEKGRSKDTKKSQ